MAKAIFISDKKFKEMAFVDANLSMDKMRPIFIDVQQLDILPALGTALFNQIDDQIINDTLSDANETLLYDYIQPYLARRAEMRAMELYTAQFANKGTIRETSENGYGANNDEINARRAALMNIAEQYRERLERFLYANVATYPLFNTPGNSLDTVYPRRKAFAGALNLEFIPTETNRYGRSPMVDDRFGDDCRRWGMLNYRYL